MIFCETQLKGAFIIEIDPKHDTRGFFARAWCAKELEAYKLRSDFVQCNISFSPNEGILRGLHYQKPPYQEVKLIRCTQGAIYDVIVDLRSESPTYLQWFGIELNSQNRRSLYVPEGFAHGFQTLEDNSEVCYPVTQFYTPDAEAGVRWDDPLFAIEWPEADPRIISDKDRCWPDHGISESSGQLFTPAV